MEKKYVWELNRGPFAPESKILTNSCFSYDCYVLTLRKVEEEDVVKSKRYFPLTPLTFDSNLSQQTCR